MISEATFIREYVRELRNKNAAAFLGAGMSMASGYVDWKGLLKDVFADLGLDPEKERDLVTVAQYHCNKTNSKAQLTQTILNHFGKEKAPTENHRILAQLPIQTYWTTNYDKLIETSLKGAKRDPDVKYDVSQLQVTRPGRAAIVYKMHGDIEHPSKTVISKEDFETYARDRAPFMDALRGDLTARTFLFLGLSFDDPNLDYILSRVRVQYEEHQRPHYCLLKAVSRLAGEDDKAFAYRKLKQDYFVRDLQRFSIQSVLVNEYADITRVLRDVARQYKRVSVFISGAAATFEPWTVMEADQFLHRLSAALASRKLKVVTGFGLGVGGPVINGVLATLNAADTTISDDSLVMRPFPQTPAANAKPRWTEYRKEMIGHAGIAVFVFGNRRDALGNLELSPGMLEEFEIARDAGLALLPVGATGHQAEVLWRRVLDDFDALFPEAKPECHALFERLNNKSLSRDELVATVVSLVDHLQTVS